MSWYLKTQAGYVIFIAPSKEPVAPPGDIFLQKAPYFYRSEYGLLYEKLCNGLSDSAQQALWWYLACKVVATMPLPIGNGVSAWHSSYALWRGPGRYCDSSAQHGNSSIDLSAISRAACSSSLLYTPSPQSQVSSLLGIKCLRLL